MTRTLLITLFLVASSFVFCQSTANYSFSNVSNASLTDMSTGSSNLLIPTSTSGDFASALAPIGFDFWLMGTRYDHFSVNSNGLMRLGKTTVTNAYSNTAANSATNTPALFAFWDDLNSYTTSSTSRVRYKVTGGAPNRILTVEWKDFIISYNSSSSTQLSTWQINLYETSGVFEYVYGAMQIASGASTVTASIGMTYANSNNNLIFLTSISSPAVSRTSGSFVTNLVNSAAVGNIANLNSAANGSRVKYTFTPPLVSASAPSALNFTAIGTSAMTLNWTDNSSNERGFAIYRSDDGGITYNFISQAAANATSSIQSALCPATTYYWKVYAVTEGALSSSLNGSQATTSCGSSATNTMAIGSAGGYNWNTGSNWSLGHVPTACEDAVITYTRTTSGNAAASVTMNASATVNSLTINGVFGTSGSSGIKTLQVLTNGFSLTVQGNLSISSTGGSNAANEVDFLAGNSSVVTIKGNATIGQPSDTRISYFGGVTSQFPEYYFKGNVTFNVNAGNSSPGNYYFDGGASQTLTSNAATYAVAFGEVEIGRSVSTTLTVGGSSAYNTNADGGNLVVNSGSTLSLPANTGFNQYTAGSETLILKANATLKLGDYTGGQTGSNFPYGYSYFSVDDASTIEYNYAGAQSPVIYTNIVYGNLTLTNASRKYINTTLFIDGTLTNNTGSTFGSDEATYIYGTAVVNNGTIDGLYANSEFGFYGNTHQTYSGTGTFGTSGTPFGSWGIDIFNSAGVSLSAPMYTYRLNLFNGGFTNSNQLKIGTTSYGIIQRGGASTYTAGSLDTYPVINCPNTLYLRYDDAAASITTGPEIPATFKTYNVYSNNVNAVTLASNLNVTNDFQLMQNTFTLGSNTLQIGNTITKTSGNINGSAGTLEMNGTVAQTIPASTFVSNNLKNLIISNTNTATGVTLGGALDVYNAVTFGAAGKILTTGDFLTFKSNSTATAYLGQMAGTNSIVGKATIERYIPLHTKAWQFLSTPITAASTQTVNQAWQEGSVAVNDNLVGGYGTQLTSSRVGATTRPSPGFDAYTPSGSSIKVYNHATGGYIGLNRTDTAISNPKGYMVLVRGNRSVTTYGALATATTMRTKGTLHTPANPPVTINVTTPGFESVGNPYASAIDFRQLTFTGGVQPDFFYLWDPKLTTVGVNSAWGLGGIQSFAWNPFTLTFDVTPGGGSFAGTNRNIESGQAFFVNAPFAAGTVSFSEASKVTNSNNVNRVPTAQVKQLRTNLSVITNGTKILLDGNMVQFDRSWSNIVDLKDGIKIANSGESIGLLREGKTLAVERRSPVISADTMFYQLGMLRVQQYELEFVAAHLEEPGLKAFLEDSYLHTSTAVSLNDTTRILFNIINVPGSYAADRFRLVFKQIKKQTMLVATTDAGRNSSIMFIDNSKSNSLANEDTRQLTLNAKPGINVYPNPVVNKLMHLQFVNQQAGTYNLELTNKLGQQVYSNTVEINTDKVIRSLQLEQTIASGTYQLTITRLNGNSITQQVVIQ